MQFVLEQKSCINLWNVSRIPWYRITTLNTGSFFSMKRFLTILFSLSLCSCQTSNNPFVSKSSILKAKTTAYTSSEKDHLKYKKKTASGKTLKNNHSIATDWSILPVNTIVKIDKQIYTVEDYGSALVKPKNDIPVIDIYLPSRTAMNRYGVHWHNNVEIVQWGSFEESLEILKDRLRYEHCRIMYKRIREKM